MRDTIASFKTAGLVLAGIVGFLSACVALDAGERSLPAGEIVDPEWNLTALAEHLSVLRREAAQAESDGTRVRYLTDRLYEYRVQPAAGQLYDLSGSRSGVMVAGHVGGRNPQVSSEAVLVSVDVEDPVGMATWLELARLQAQFSRTGIMPERSVVFVAWQGAVEGIRSYLQNPTWLPAEITAWVYLHPPEDKVGELRQIGRARGWRSYFAMSEQAPAEEATAVQAQNLAAQAHATIRAEVLSGGPFLPIRSDTLFVPPEAD